ncbi:MAG: DEAD/DEAH box helicase [Clostridia bacterium]|nr:DEAD/DEAH box helicase [Clostridia bacterium]
MANGANFVHKQLRTELEEYIKSQYFGKSRLLLSALGNHIDDEGLFYQKPFIESSPAYVTVQNGIDEADIEEWMKEYFRQLAEAELGVFPNPFSHQTAALEKAVRGENLFVSTGTGSGKTECFMWPLLAKLASEAKNSKRSWAQRGIRTIVMYPMNALVSDQVSRLRKMIGDPGKKFIKIFRETCGEDVRRPQFGMYTGRTPYPGAQPTANKDRNLEKTLERMSFPKNDADKEYYENLLNEGKIPAKADMNQFLRGLHEGRHIPNDDDAELITRFEMQQFCPGILITNYSMLEYMLLRPIEQKIWDDTRDWLAADSENKLLFVIDEAHMYRGSSGGEVALLIRRLFHKLGISRERVQFILTTASMPNRNEQDMTAVMKFANELTASDTETRFCYLTGEREVIDGRSRYDIPVEILLSSEPGEFEGNDELKLSALLSFWRQSEGFDNRIDSLDAICRWMYENLIYYRPFRELIKYCRGNAVSLGELSTGIFPQLEQEDALKAVSVLLAIAPLAKNDKGAVLFPARMHMLFKGISGVYACANPECSCSHTDGTLTLGEIFLSDGNLTCPNCGSAVYELYNDRRCGALFFKGYVLDENNHSVFREKNVYLWRYPGLLMDSNMREIHLFIPSDDFQMSSDRGKNPIKPCYLDVKSGFINFADDSSAGKIGIRKLYYCDYSAKGRPQIITFQTCPHCRHRLAESQLTSFSTRGNQSFFNLIKAQFQLQPAVKGKENNLDRFPNEGRKVLLFSDSRQRAAKLARDMSEASDISAARQLFAIAIKTMEEQRDEQSINSLYDYFCLAAARHHVQMFHGSERTKFAEDCASAQKNYSRYAKHGRDYSPRFAVANAPVQMQEYILRLFAGGYNTLYDSATSWIEPTKQALFDAIDALEENGVIVTEDEFIDFFNAWVLSICDMFTAIGHTIGDTVRLKVRPRYGDYGLSKDWTFSRYIRKIMGWSKENETEAAWKRVLKETFLDAAQPDNGKLYVDLSRVKPRFDSAHIWYKCEQCSELTPFTLKGQCPSCASPNIHQMTGDEYEALSFWEKPIDDAIQGKPIQVIDTEEHTAQLSHKDQLYDLWSRTEQYELRFQDLIQDGETPVDILSSTTTMEVGIDIGSLVAVGLRNIPPMRENYQQRAGRAGRRGSSLSTIVTFCEDNPHDTLYFHDPVPMFRGDPRKPWIDVQSEKLLRRHLAMVILQEFLAENQKSLDTIPAAVFLTDLLDAFKRYLASYDVDKDKLLLPVGAIFNYSEFENELNKAMDALKEKLLKHPELFGVGDGTAEGDEKSLLDALYEEGIIPTYSFPKNVVSTYIPDVSGKIKYEVDRGLDVAIGEYAPGRAIVVDKQTYQIGGFYYPGSERRRGQARTPARAYTEDPNYVKQVIVCGKCGWFGLMEDNTECCPFCGNNNLTFSREMMRPWGFAPRDAQSIYEAQLSEEYSFVQQPLYSTLPDGEEMKLAPNCRNIRIASRTNQRIIMLNKGSNDKGFIVCKDCGAAMPGGDISVLNDINRPYKSKYAQSRCRHADFFNVNLGYDFITDMLVLEFALDNKIIDSDRKNNPWLGRAAQSLAEALRLAASKKLDVEFTELVTGYRFRTGCEYSYVDIYLYDSLSSGAGYAVGVADSIAELLADVKELLSSCDCEAACSNCLKHYRNQHLHGMLDRFAALQLLEWGVNGTKAEPIDFKEQVKMIMPLSNILGKSGCEITTDCGISVSRRRNAKKIVIYPAMWIEPHDSDAIFVSDTYMKYAKPYAVQKILDNI